MQTAHYFQWGWILITVPNLVVIALMIVVFLAVVFVQLPVHQDDKMGEHHDQLDA